MTFIPSSIDVFLASSVIALIFWAYITYPDFQTRNKEERLQTGQQITSERAAGSETRRLLAVFIALHTVYILYKLVVQSPQNIFSLLHLSLNEPSDNIRIMLARQARVFAIPSTLDNLLTRLQSFDARVAYVRFGHSVVQDCDHCTTLDDFGLYALPPPILEYARMAAVLGLVTIQRSGRESWRFWALAMLALAAMAELYFVLVTEVSFSPREKKTVMIHEFSLRARRVLFLLLPLLLYLIPARRPLSPPLHVLPELTARCERTRTQLQLLRLSSAARARHPTLRGSADAWWIEQREDAHDAVNDHALREMASKVGILLDKDDDKDNASLRSRTKAVVEAIQNYFHPRK